jgi:hypothetical protein
VRRLKFQYRFFTSHFELRISCLVLQVCLWSFLSDTINRMIEVVYFDLGKVIVDFDHSRAAQELLKVTPLSLKEAMAVLSDGELVSEDEGTIVVPGTLSQGLSPLADGSVNREV